MILQYSVIIIYTICLMLIFMYALAQLNLLINYLKYRNKEDNASKFDFNKIAAPNILFPKLTPM